MPIAVIFISVRSKDTALSASADLTQLFRPLATSGENSRLHLLCLHLTSLPLNSGVSKS